MPSSIIAHTEALLLPKNISERGSNFNVLRKFASNIETRIETMLEQYQAVLTSAAYVAFSESLYEFLKNSVDKKAVYFCVCVYFKPDNKEVSITIRDLDTQIASSSTDGKLTAYDWEVALKQPSPKNIGIRENRQCAQHHLALAQTAFFLQQHQGNLFTGTNQFGGFDLMLHSSSEKCAAHIRDTYTYYNHNLNSVERMLLSLFQKQIEENIINAKNEAQVKMALTIIHTSLQETFKNPSETVQTSVRKIENLITKIASNLMVTVAEIPILAHPSVNKKFSEAVKKSSLRQAEIMPQQSKAAEIAEQSKIYPTTAVGFYRTNRPPLNGLATNEPPQKAQRYSPSKTPTSTPILPSFTF